METDEKIYHVIKALKDAHEITPSEGATFLNPQAKHIVSLSELDISQILNKLAKDEKIIEIGGYPEGYADDYFIIYVKPEFVKYAKRIIDSYEQEHSLDRLGTLPIDEDTRFGSLGLEITFSSSREVILNDLFLLSKPDFGSENDLVFGYLFQNQNKLISLQELEREATKQPIKKKLHEVVRDLGFTKDLLKAFFSISKNAITFTNPVTFQRLQELELPKIKVSAR